MADRLRHVQLRDDEVMIATLNSRAHLRHYCAKRRHAKCRRDYRGLEAGLACDSVRRTGAERPSSQATDGSRKPPVGLEAKKLLPGPLPLRDLGYRSGDARLFRFLDLDETTPYSSGSVVKNNG